MNDNECGYKLKLSKYYFTHYSKQLLFLERLLKWMREVESEDFK